MRALRQAEEPAAAVVVEPAVEAARTVPFARKEHDQRGKLAGIALGLGMFGHIVHDRIDPINKPTIKSSVDMRTSARECLEHTHDARFATLCQLALLVYIERKPY